MAPSATATDGLVVSSPWRQGAGRVHDPGSANLRAARQEHQVAARIRLAGDRNEKFEEFRTRPDNLAARSVANALDSFVGLRPLQKLVPVRRSTFPEGSMGGRWRPDSDKEPAGVRSTEGATSCKNLRGKGSGGQAGNSVIQEEGTFCSER